MDATRRPRRGPGLRTALVAAGIVAAAAVAAAAWLALAARPAARPVSLRDLAAARGSVVVGGPVDAVLARGAFVVGGDAYGRMLVVGRDVAAAPAEGDVVSVVGSVRSLDVQGLESVLGEPLNRTVFRSFAGRVVVADSVAVTRRRTPAAPVAADVAALLARPARYYGKTVAVVGARARPLDANVVLLGRLLVVGDPSVLRRVRAAARVRAVGVVSAFDVREVEGVLARELDDPRLQRYAGRTVLLASTVADARRGP